MTGYHTPRFKYGTVVTCAIRGPVKIVGLTDGRIPWPKCRSGKRARAIILYGALAEAVRRESAEAVMHWFGVGGFTVSKWRRALGVGRKTEGTSALHSRWTPETILSKEARRACLKANKSPERAAKISAALTGRKPSPETVEAIRRSHLGKRHSAATRRKMSEARKRRTVVTYGKAWTADDEALLGTMTDKEVGERTGRKEGAVSARRYRIGVSAFMKRKSRGGPAKWTPAKDRLLGTMSDVKLASKLRCSPMSVFYRRKQLKIPAFR